MQVFDINAFSILVIHAFLDCGASPRVKYRSKSALLMDAPRLLAACACACVLLSDACVLLSIRFTSTLASKGVGPD